MAGIGTVCVYCGASNKVAAHFLETAFAFGRLLGRAGVGLVYGGGRIGLMGRVADGVLVEGGRVTGIIPRRLADHEIAHHAVQELVVVETMHERKQLMAERSDGFVILPGGLGTLDEMFEIVTWRQLGFHEKPVVGLDLGGYWTPLRALIDHMIAEGFVQDGDRALMRWVDTPEAVLPALSAP